MLAPTHMLFGLALAHILRLPKLPAFLAGLAIDMDIIFNFIGVGSPFIHRGLVHTPLFIICITAIWYFGRGRSVNALSAGVGGLAHIFLDFFNSAGIMVLYPLATFFALPLVDYANIAVNAGISSLSIAVFALYWFRPNDGRTLKEELTLASRIRQRLVPYRQRHVPSENRKREIIVLAMFITLAMLIIWISSFTSLSFDPLSAYY